MPTTIRDIVRPRDFLEEHRRLKERVRKLEIGLPDDDGWTPPPPPPVHHSGVEYTMSADNELYFGEPNYPAGRYFGDTSGGGPLPPPAHFGPDADYELAAGITSSNSMPLGATEFRIRWGNIDGQMDMLSFAPLGDPYNASLPISSDWTTAASTSLDRFSHPGTIEWSFVATNPTTGDRFHWALDGTWHVWALSTAPDYHSEPFPQRPLTDVTWAGFTALVPPYDE